ncbi:hypothetical protein Q5P01_001001 [Channa striata]|uniref:Uncharacterized protein n=1 Tax=Channa striata TaxID=64152 RepID=A0AA88LMV3_CHASR|nr:hypothetical protein Q5P01_001001 [Channa striata]
MRAPVRRAATPAAPPAATYELEVCRRDLEDAKRALHEALDEREAMRLKLSESAASADSRPSLGARGLEAGELDHPHLDWVGRHYLAVSLPEDRMFRPGESVTPVGVLQKLFEMRVGERQGAGFSILLENVNIALSQAEPEWYAKHFGFTRPRVHANGYVSTDKVETEDFAWLLFEYGAQAPFVEVLAGLLNVLSSTSKGGVTTVALQLGKSLYAAGVALFRETVSRASEAFARVRERARRVREAQGSVSVPLTAGLQEEHSDLRRGWAQSRNTALRSVLEGIEVPGNQVVPLQARALSPVTRGRPRAGGDDSAPPKRRETRVRRSSRCPGTAKRNGCGVRLHMFREPSPHGDAGREGSTRIDAGDQAEGSGYCQEEWGLVSAWATGRACDLRCLGSEQKHALEGMSPGNQVVPLQARALSPIIEAGDQAEGSKISGRASSKAEARRAGTNKARGALMESGSLARVHTFHKLMGFKKELLDDALSPEDFVERYRRTYRDAISRLALCGSAKFLRRAIDRHSCERLRPGPARLQRDLRAAEGDPTPLETAPWKTPSVPRVNVLIVGRVRTDDGEPTREDAASRDPLLRPWPGASDHPGGQRVTVATRGVRSPSVGKRAPRRAPVVLDSAPRKQEAVRGPGLRRGPCLSAVQRGDGGIEIHLQESRARQRARGDGSEPRAREAADLPPGRAGDQLHRVA